MSRNSGFTPPPIPVSPEAVQGSSVRRHHTISSTSGRNGARISERRESEEFATEEDGNDDEWTGGSPMAGEKQASLQRNLSLPSKYHRVSRDQPSTHSGSLTPSNAVGGLSSLDAGPEDEEWAGVANALYEADDVEGVPTSQTNPENMYSNSPPSAAAAVRRHVSMTDGQRVRNKTAAGGLQRYPTVSSKPPIRSTTMDAATETANEYPADYEEEGEPAQPDEQGAFSPDSAYGGMQQTAWGTGGTETNWNTGADWRINQQQQAGIDEMTNSLSNMDLQHRQAPNYARGGPRFDMGASGQYPDYNQQLALTQAQRLQLNTEVPTPGAPGSAPAYAPPIGHAPYGSSQRDSVASAGSGDKDHPRTAPGAEWEQKNRMLKGQGGNSGQNFHGQYGGSFGNAPPPPLLPPQYLNQAQSGRHGNMGMTGGNYGAPTFIPTAQNNQNLQQQQQQQQQQQVDPSLYLSSPLDVPSMIARKGYNPATFDIRPPFARYFVIKSYTEDDVHKSLKYEIWSSTDPGNKRLDKAFKECAGRGPIYLFFSVNASGHFCGMAEMLTPVDYTRSSTVWASDKWKGVFKVRWVFVRDIPNAVLRNIRLNNTQERKPVTNSRDTQELLPEAGHEMLRIFFTHPAKTSLLQDFAFYELQALQKQQQGLSSTTPLASPPPVQATLLGQGPPQQYTINNQMSYGQAQGGGNQQPLHSQIGIGPPITMSMGGTGHPGLHSPYGGQVALGIGPQIASSVLRGSSPGPIGSNLSGNMGYPGLNMNGGGNVGNQNSGPASGGNF